MLRGLIGLAAWVACATACQPRAAAPGAARGRPNVLLVTVDTLRADHVGAYGARDAETPTMDALAAGGVRFETAIASSPSTLPSHASILTGHYPPRHGARHNGLFQLDASMETLAERLQQAGYRTGAVVSAYVLARHYGLDQGFDAYDDEMSSRPSVPGGYLERDAREATQRALAWLEQAPRPFFLWLHYYDPHADYAPPSPHAERFRERPYAGEIAYVDAELAQVVTALRSAGELSRTLVVLTSDHGEALGEHREQTHSYTLYDATLAVPLLMQGPGVPAGRVAAGVVRTVDVAPTILALLELEPLSGIDGSDLMPLFGGGASDRIAYAETLATQYHHGWSPLFAIRTRNHHYVRAPRPELYAVQDDPAQLRDLAARDRSAVAPLLAELDAEVERVLADAQQLAPATLDDEARARLAALGYTIPDTVPAASGIDPKDGLVWTEVYFEALQFVHRNDLEAARHRLEEMLAAVPTSALAHSLLARVLVLQGRADGALPHAERAAALLPSAANLAHVGDIHVHLGDATRAGAAYRAAAERDPTEPLAQVGLMWLALRDGDRPQAEERARRAIALNPAGVAIRQTIGTVWEQAGAYQEALDAYQAALDLDPDAEQTHMHLAIQLARLGREADATRHLALAGGFADVPYLRNRLGIVYAARGDVERAERIFRELARRHPEYATARHNLAILLRGAERARAGSPAPPAALPR